jgi:hypothetical protein
MRVGARLENSFAEGGIEPQLVSVGWDQVPPSDLSLLIIVRATYLRNRGFYGDIPEDNQSNYLSPYIINNDLHESKITIHTYHCEP